MTLRSASRAPSGPFLAAWPKIPAISPLVAVLTAILLVLIVPPAVFLLRISLHETLPDGSLGPFTLRFYEGLFSGRFFLPSLYNTMIYSFGSALIAIVIGTVQALIVERTNTPGRNLAFFGAIISLGVPHILYTVAWLLLLGRSGPLNDLIAILTQQPQAINVYSMWGMILIEGIGFVPLTFLLMSAVFRSMDASFEEAAIVAGASPLRAFWEVTIRMGVPAICALAMLIFIRTFESFEVPALVGLAGNINVLTTTIYQSARRTGAPNYGELGAYSICLILIVTVLLIWQNNLARNAHRYQTITGKGFRPRIVDLGGWKYLCSALLFVLFMFVTVIPAAILVFTSFLPFYEGVSLEFVEQDVARQLFRAVRARLVPRFDFEHADPGCLDRDNRRAVYGAVRMAGRAAGEGCRSARPPHHAAAGLSGDHSGRRVSQHLREFTGAALRDIAVNHYRVLGALPVLWHALCVRGRTADSTRP